MFTTKKIYHQMRNNYKVVLWNVHMNETNELKEKMIIIEKKEE